MPNSKRQQVTATFVTSRMMCMSCASGRAADSAITRMAGHCGSLITAYKRITHLMVRMKVLTACPVMIKTRHKE